MLDMTSTIAPKSDQINADDLIGGPRTITINRVTGNEGNAEQPVNVFFEGHNNPFRPCKSMRRVMVSIWGADASQYVGKSMTIYRDPKVKWGGMEVGGIRISHMSGLTGPKQMALTETRAKRTPYTVQPLVMQEQRDKAADWTAEMIDQIKGAGDVAILDGIMAKIGKGLSKLDGERPELHAQIRQVEAERREWLSDDADAFEGAE